MLKNRTATITRNAAIAVACLAATPGVALAGGTTAPRTAVGEAEAVGFPALDRPEALLNRTLSAGLRHARTERRARQRAERRREHRRLVAEFATLPGGVSQATLDTIAACESGGSPTAVSSDGTYRGKYQFDYGTWASVGGSGDPAAASEAEQDYRAALLYTQSGSSPWPICGA